MANLPRFSKSIHWPPSFAGFRQMPLMLIRRKSSSIGDRVPRKINLNSQVVALRSSIKVVASWALGEEIAPFCLANLDLSPRHSSDQPRQDGGDVTQFKHDEYHVWPLPQRGPLDLQPF